MCSSTVGSQGDDAEQVQSGRIPEEEHGRPDSLHSAGVRSLIIVAVSTIAIEALRVAIEAKAAVESSRPRRVANAQIPAVQPQIEAFTGQLGGSSVLVTKPGQDPRGPEGRAPNLSA